MSDTSTIFAQVRAATDIVAVIGDHVALKRAGREFKGLCPFHPDHRPSMAVVPHKQIFHCFVCGHGGDVFTFVEEFHKIGKGEALRMLAQRAGIKLPELPARRGQTEGPSAKERIQGANEWACSFFENALRSAVIPGGKAGLDYLRGRGLTDETILKFRLGMAPTGWTGLVTAAMKASRTLADFHEAGLFKQKQDGSFYDGFRTRVMFPIVDSIGRVIAFGGRILEERRDASGIPLDAKYLNSPDSPLFNKSASLYGINHARKAIVRSGTVVIVEGYMDVIACHQAGVENVVATLGTALTPEHAKALRHYAETIVLVFDSDDAGRRAADRALQTFLENPVEVKIAAVPDGKDPCDFCMKAGGEAFRKIVDAAPDALEYRLAMFQSQFRNTGSVTERQKATQSFLEFIRGMLGAGTVDPLRRALVLGKVAALCRIPETQLDQMAGARRQAVETVPATLDPKSLTGKSAAEGWLLGVLLGKPELYEGVKDFLSVESFQTFGGLAAAVFERLEDGPKPFLELLEGMEGGDRAAALAMEHHMGGLLDGEGDEGWARVLRQCIQRVNMVGRAWRLPV